LPILHASESTSSSRKPGAEATGSAEPPNAEALRNPGPCRLPPAASNGTPSGQPTTPSRRRGPQFGTNLWLRAELPSKTGQEGSFALKSVTSPRPSNRMDAELNRVARLVRSGHESPRAGCIAGAWIGLAELLIEGHHSRTRHPPAVFADKLRCWWYHEWHWSPGCRVVPTTVPTLAASPEEVSLLRGMVPTGLSDFGQHYRKEHHCRDPSAENKPIHSHRLPSRPSHRLFQSPSLEPTHHQ